MKRFLFFSGLMLSLFTFSSCQKDNDDNKTNEEVNSCNLPSAPPPSGAHGSWITSTTNGSMIVDSYNNGAYVQHLSSGAEQFEVDEDGKNLKSYSVSIWNGYTAITYMTGTLEFDQTAGTVSYHICKSNSKFYQGSNGAYGYEKTATQAEIDALNESYKDLPYTYNSNDAYPLKIYWRQQEYRYRRP